MRSFRLRFGKLRLLSWELCTPPTHILIASTLKKRPFHASTGQGHQMTRSHKPSNLQTLAALPRPLQEVSIHFIFP